MERELTLEHWIDRAFWGLLCAVAYYTATQMSKLTESVNLLNTKLTVYIARSDNHAAELQDHENRIRYLENGDR